MNAARTASLILIASGLVTLAIGFFLFQKRQEVVRKWRPVDAEVIRVWMDQHTSGDVANQSTSDSAHYELGYTVDGKPIRSNTQSEDVSIAEPAQVKARLDRHSPGTRGIVYFNPDNPSQVRLNLGRNVNTFAAPLWLLLASVFLLLLGGSLWFIGTPAVYW